MARRLIAFAAVLLGGVAGCAAATPSESGAEPAVAAVTTTVTPTYDGVFTLAFGGDVHFEEEVEPALADHSVLAPVTAMFGDAELVMVNLETAITERGSPEPKRWTFRTPATALDALASAGVDVVSMANNHGVDFGAVGLEDTLAAKQDSPIPVVGIGAEADEAFAPYVTEIEGISVAILAGTQVPDHTAAVWAASDSSGGVASARDPDRLLSAVRAAAESSEVVIVYLHWGAERVDCPTREQRTLAQALADAGADIIVGAHAHVQLGSGWLGDAYVNYGLGNFIWWRHNSEPEGTTGVLTLTVDHGVVVEHDLTPAMTPPTGGVPSEVTGSTAERVLATWDELRKCADLADKR